MHRRLKTAREPADDGGVLDQLRRLLRPGRGRSARSVDLVLLVGACLGIHLLSVGAVELAPEGSVIASWWPAAGLGTGLAAAVAPTRRPLVYLAVLLGSVTGNLDGGRAASIALLFAVFNVVEVVVTTRLLTGGGAARLTQMSDVTRLVLAVAVGASALGLLTSTTVSLLLDESFVHTFVAVVPSHTAAQLLVVPAILAWRTRTRHRRPGEAAVQAGLLLLVTQLVFGVDNLPLAFVPLTVLVWGAVRLGLRAVTVELLVLVIIVTLLSSDGHGSFAAGATMSGALSTLILQVFAVCAVIVGLTLALAVRQREESTVRVSASEALFRGGFTESLLGMLMLEHRDGELRVTQANPVACRMLGRSDDSVIGHDFTAFLDPSEHDGLAVAARRLATGHSTGWRREVASTGSTPSWFEMALSVLPGEADPTQGDVLSVQLVDVTARRDAESQLARLALHDSLTGLANRVLLADRLDHVLVAARRSGVGPTLLFLDLDDFKQVNDQAGHAAGDIVLRTVAERLVSTARAADTVARLGGDEFVVLCPETDDPQAGRALAQRLVDLICRPITVDGQDVVVRLSVGVVLGSPFDTADTLLRDADSAMYAAKAQGKGRAVLFQATAVDNDPVTVH